MRNLGLIVSFLGLVCAPALLADTVETVDGEVLTGTIERSSFVLVTEDGRRLEVPKASIREIRLRDGSAHFDLAGGQTLRGRLVDEEVHLELDLYDRVLRPEEIRSIRFPPPGLGIAPGAQIEVQLVGPLDPFGEPAGPVLLCVVEELRVDGEVAIPRAAPVFGRSPLDAEAGGDGAGPAGIELTEVVAADGSSIPLRPRLRLQGVGGAAPRGGVGASDVFPAPGLLGVAETAEEARVGLEEGQLSGRAAERCDAALSAADLDAFIPVEWLDREVEYAGAPEPLELQVAVNEVFEKGHQTVLLGNAVVDDTEIASIMLTLAERRKGARLKIRTTLAVAPSRDRKVDLGFELVHAGQQIAGREERGVEAEEGKRKTEGTRLDLSPEDLEALSGPGPALLRISMTVEDD